MLSPSSTLQENWNKIPRDLQQTIAKSDWPGILNRIGQEASLTTNQVDQLGIEVLLIALGLEHRNEFEINLEANLSVSEGVAKSIEEKINRDIFSPISSYLDKFENDGQQQEVEQKAKYSKLPQDIQQALESVETEKALQGIAETYKLHIDQVGVLYDLADKVLMGELKSKDFTPELVRISGLDTQTANNITRDINTTVFSPLQQSLRQISEKKANLFEEKVSTMFQLPKQDNSLIIKPYPPAEQIVTPNQAIPGIDIPKPTVDDPYLERV